MSALIVALASMVCSCSDDPEAKELKFEQPCMHWGESKEHVEAEMSHYVLDTTGWSYSTSDSDECLAYTGKHEEVITMYAFLNDELVGVMQVFDDATKEDLINHFAPLVITSDEITTDTDAVGYFLKDYKAIILIDKLNSGYPTVSYYPASLLGKSRSGLIDSGVVETGEIRIREK